MPTPERLAEARAAVGHQFLKLDATHHTAQLLSPSMRLDLGGIAMGYAVDEALKLLARARHHAVLVDASGDIGVGDPPPGKQGWTIGVMPLSADGTPSRDDPAGQRRRDDLGRRLSTRRHRRQALFAHRRPAHRPGPDRSGRRDRDRPRLHDGRRLGYGRQRAGAEGGLELIEKTPGAAAFIVRPTDGEPEILESRRFKAFVVP